MKIRWGAPAGVIAAMVIVACVGEDAILSVAPTSDAGTPDASTSVTDSAVGPVDTGASVDTGAPQDSGPSASRLELSDLELDFGTVDVASNVHKSLTVTNRTAATVTVTTAFSGQEFSVSINGCQGVALAPNAECVLELELAPTSSGEKKATLDFSVDGVIVSKATARGFGKDVITVDVTSTGAGAATGVVEGGVINCGTACTGLITRAATIPALVLTATPDKGSAFSGWTGACAGEVTNTCTVPLAGTAVNGHVAVGATWVLGSVLDFTLAGGADTALQVTSSPPGISCTGGSCATTAVFVPGTSVTLTATSTGGKPDVFRFIGCPDVDKTKCTVVMTGNKTVKLAATHYNVGFVSSARYDGNLGGLSGADKICNDLADAQSLPGHFNAWLSTYTMKAPDRFPAGGFVRRDGAILATDTSKLSARALHPLWLDESGTQHIEDATGEQVWTGTTKDGTAVGDGLCGDWSTTTPTIGGGHVGVTQGGVVTWTSYFNVSCAEKHRLYCLEDDLSTSVPLPTLGTNRRVFVSKGVRATNAGLDDMDLLCSTEASSASLPPGFIALLPKDKDTSAASRLSTAGSPWARVDGVLLAPTTLDFVGKSLDVAIDLHADGTAIDTEVFTGYIIEDYAIPRVFKDVPNGSKDGTCGGWSSAAAAGAYAGVGQTAYAGYRPTAAYFALAGDPTCATAMKSIYCIQP